MRLILRISIASALLVPALAGCTTIHPAAAGAPGGNRATAGAPSGVAPTASGGDQCRYLSTDDIRQALAYSGTMTATQDSPMGFARCRYEAPDNGFVGAIVAVQSGRDYFDQQKSIQTAPDCTSAGVGDESLYCPNSQQGLILFVAKGQSVSVSVTNVQSLTSAKGTDWTQAALALARLVVSRL